MAWCRQMMIHVMSPLQLAWSAVTQPQAQSSGSGGLSALIGAVAAASLGGSGAGSQLSADPMRPLALMPDLQVRLAAWLRS